MVALENDLVLPGKFEHVCYLPHSHSTSEYLSCRNSLKSMPEDTSKNAYRILVHNVPPLEKTVTLATKSQLWSSHRMEAHREDGCAVGPGVGVDVPPSTETSEPQKNNRQVESIYITFKKKQN